MKNEIHEPIIFLFLCVFIIICLYLASSCTIPENLKEDDPVLYDEIKKSRDQNIRQGGKIYRKHSGKVIEKIDEALDE